MKVIFGARRGKGKKEKEKPQEKQLFLEFSKEKERLLFP